MTADRRDRRTGRYLERLLVKADDRILLVTTSSIEWIGSDGNYVELQANGDQFRLRARLSDLQRCLDPTRFMRVHRSAIVNLDRIAEIVRADSGSLHIVLEGGETLPLSRTYRKDFEQRFGVPS